MTTPTLSTAAYQATLRRLAAERLTYRQRRQIRRARWDAECARTDTEVGSVLDSLDRVTR